MKKILTITLSLLLLLSTTACSLNLGFNSSKYELTAGHYDVPDDVPIGKYDIVVTDGRGVFTTFDADGSYDIIEGMDIEGIEGRIKEYHNAKLESGSSIEISSTLKVKLVPRLINTKKSHFDVKSKRDFYLHIIPKYTPHNFFCRNRWH